MANTTYILSAEIVFSAVCRMYNISKMEISKKAVLYLNASIYISIQLGIDRSLEQMNR